MNVLGLDLGGTKLAGALFDEQGNAAEKCVIPLEGRSGEEAGSLVTSTIQDYLGQFKDIRAVGLSIPGIYYRDSGRVWVPNIKGWEEYPLLERIRESLSADHRHLKVAIDNDRACYILGETWKGAARGCKDAIYIAVGTGIGAGILTGGKVLRGAGDIAGSIGWMALQKPWRDGYESCGCFEYHASGEGIARVAREYLDQAREAGEIPDGRLGELEPDRITAADVFEAHQSGDPIATQVTRESIDLWGMAVANLVSVFNPEKIIFGGGVFGPAIRFLPQIREEAGRWAQPVSIHQMTLEASRLGGEAGLIGAGQLALLEVNHPAD